MTTHRTALTEDQRRALCRAKVTLNGQPAAVSGWRAARARVTDYATGLGAEWSWDAVAHVVEHNDGAFSSGPLVLHVQPGLDVLVEDSHNVLIDITTPDGLTSLARSGAVTNIDRLIQALEFAREWIAIEEANR